MYGYAKAYDNVAIRGITNPTAYIWWLDVETENTWPTVPIGPLPDPPNRHAMAPGAGGS